MSAQSLDHLRGWVGKTETRADTITTWPVAALGATLDRNDPEPTPGDALPPGWHWLYFLDAKPASELGPEGHPKRGGFLPPVPLPRRMWAGGRIEFLRPLRIGDALRRDSEIISVEPKRGHSGDLVFVTVRHTVTTGGEVAIVEEHDIVYREAAKPGDPPPRGKPAPAQAAWQRTVTPDPVLLFRYSALTFNGHRIHYDLDYVKNEEHYPGLIVHGPLQTTLLLDLCRRHAPRPVKKLDYRALHPVFHTERFTVNGNPGADGATAELWTANAAGNYAMAGTAVF
ncbi:MAG: MaoC family dehydratase N-terminal domain-containing protein [Betaproteobacteria bacterium]|nr:MaoC family dehydratase N-terminal domain-containing protein [Betaproteobacteria bacterium]